MKQYSTGLFIGRFQPFHFGHLSAIQQGLAVCERLILVIGSANRNFSIENPLTITERILMLEKVLEQEQLAERIAKPFALDDNPNNLEWVEKLIHSVSEFNVVVGNNSLVTTLTTYKGYVQFHPKLTRREILQGQIIRNLVLKEKSWQERVPPYLLPILSAQGFESRLLSLNS